MHCYFWLSFSQLYRPRRNYIQNLTFYALNDATELGKILKISSLYKTEFPPCRSLRNIHLLSVSALHSHMYMHCITIYVYDADPVTSSI